MCIIYCRIKYLEGTMSLIRLWSNVCNNDDIDYVFLSIPETLSQTNCH